MLPPANKREATQRKAKEPEAKVTETQQGVGGRSGKAPKETPKQQPAPRPEPAPRYATGEEVDQLAERVLAARQVVNRGKLAEVAEVTGSAVWRWEHGRIHPDEVTRVRATLETLERRIAAGEFVKPAAAPRAPATSKADLLHRIEVAAELARTARGDKSIGKAALVDSLLAVLDPSTDAAPQA